ncbi:MAG TPA: ABC transporter substrate-binding protein [Thermodesulfobacteriota bacterium]|nr:ABC transporter substrate-binding protein [Thermodesulfobacteriota bacterium]
MKAGKMSRNQLIAVPLMVFLFVFAFAPGQALAQADKTPRGGTLKMIYQEPTHLNMAIVSGTPTGVPALQIFAGLVQFDENFKPQPYLAKKWEVSADGKNYTFYLEEGATFHDGKPITSEDVAFSLETVKANHPFGVAMFRAVDRIDITDPHKVIFRLNHPYPAFMAATHPLLLPVIPKHIYGPGEIRKNPANQKPVGSGPFKFVEWKRGQHIILERNENFFRKGKPYLDRIILEFITDSNARTVAMETGATHIIPFSYLSGDDALRLAKLPQFAMTQKGYEAIGARTWFAVNLRKPPLNDKRVRKAIAHALDRNFIVKEIFRDFGKPATAPFHHAGPFYNGKLPQYELNLNKANQLLDEAGFKRKTDGMRFSLNVDWIPTPTNQAVCEYTREQLKKVGINANLRASPDFPGWAAKISAWDFDLNFDSVFDYPDPVIGIERMYISKNIKNLIWTNTMGYNNPEVDRLFAEAQVEQNFAKRKNLYHKVQEILMDELPLIWLQEGGFYTFYSKEFDGIPMDVWGVLNPYDTIYWRKGRTG